MVQYMVSINRGQGRKNETYLIVENVKYKHEGMEKWLKKADRMTQGESKTGVVAD